MEPLLYEVSKNSSVAICPIIDIIDKENFAVVQAMENIGSFELRQMAFTWSMLTPRIKASQGAPNAPFM